MSVVYGLKDSSSLVAVVGSEMWLLECVERFCSSSAVEHPELDVLGGVSPFKDGIEAAGSCRELAAYVKVVLHLLGAGGSVSVLLFQVNARAFCGDIALDVCLTFGLVLASGVAVEVEVSCEAVLQCVGNPIPVLLEGVVIRLVAIWPVTGGVVDGLVDRRM